MVPLSADVRNRKSSPRRPSTTSRAPAHGEQLRRIVDQALEAGRYRHRARLPRRGGRR